MQPTYEKFNLPSKKWDLAYPEFAPNFYDIETAIYKGKTNKSLIIIVGKGGSCNGYKDKYTTIASNLVDNYGINVFVVENPGETREDPELFIDCTIKFIRGKLKSFGYEKNEIYMMGISAGGHFVGRFAFKYKEISKILLVNPVLDYFDKLKYGFESFNGKITIIQGKLDYEYGYKDSLNSVNKDIKYIELDGIDHQFSTPGGFELFLSLPEKYLLTQ